MADLVEQEGEVLLAREVSALLRCGRSTVYDLFQAGKLAGFRVGDGVRIYRTSVDQYKTAQANHRAVPLCASTLPSPAKSPRPRRPALRPSVIGGYGHGL